MWRANWTRFLRCACRCAQLISSSRLRRANVSQIVIRLVPVLVLGFCDSPYGATKPVVAKRAPAEPCHPIKTRLKRWSCAPCTATGVTCVAFWPSIPPLQVVPSFACSVASLSRCPGHQLPGRHGLRQVILADYLLDQGGPSTCIAGHVALQCTPSPQFNKEQEA